MSNKIKLFLNDLKKNLYRVENVISVNIVGSVNKNNNLFESSDIDTVVITNNLDKKIYVSHIIYYLILNNKIFNIINLDNAFLLFETICS